MRQEEKKDLHRLPVSAQFSTVVMLIDACDIDIHGSQHKSAESRAHAPSLCTSSTEHARPHTGRSPHVVASRRPFGDRRVHDALEIAKLAPVGELAAGGPVEDPLSSKLLRVRPERQTGRQWVEKRQGGNTREVRQGGQRQGGIARGTGPGFFSSDDVLR